MTTTNISLPQQLGLSFDQDWGYYHKSIQEDCLLFRDKGGCALLTDWSVLLVQGEDAAPFLHQQFTGVIHAMQIGSVKMNAWCEPHGKVIANFYIIRSQENRFFLLMRSDIVDKVQNGLSRFILRAKVTIEKNQSILLGFSQFDPAVTFIQNDTSVASCSTIVSFSDGMIIYLSADRSDAAYGLLLMDTSYVNKLPLLHTNMFGDLVWQDRAVLSHTPWIGVATSCMYLPQFLNLDKCDAVSFDKGCYPGQEVIARLYHKGRVNRRLYRFCFTSSGDNPFIAAGSHILAEHGTMVGAVLNSAPIVSATGNVLAVVQCDAIDKQLIIEHQGSHYSIQHIPS